MQAIWLGGTCAATCHRLSTYVNAALAAHHGIVWPCVNNVSRCICNTPCAQLDLLPCYSLMVQHLALLCSRVHVHCVCLVCS